MQNDVLYNRIMKKIDELEPGGGGGNIPIYAIYSEGSSIEYCHINGDFSEAYQNWQNDVPMLFTFSEGVGTGGRVFTGLIQTYKYESNHFVLFIDSVSGFYWSAEGIEYWVD